MTALLSIKLVRYAVVGALTLAIYLACGEVAHGLALPLIWQASLPFIAAVAFNYVLQRVWVFEDSRPTASSLPKYGVMIVIGYVINLLALVALSPRMPLVMAQLTAATLVVISNAFFSFFWVFLTRGGGANTSEAKNSGSF
ncbi:GtrA family protein [Caenimonas soli]|uniref:GtrA family protein n=1 Tax=Caenimonas soli TaxID=2735555 RepID=UPI001557A020|nr:GtrA family protein [Caenimonas soli]NPC55459.1 GtrA family protein [Caenimonas soli]